MRPVHKLFNGVIFINVMLALLGATLASIGSVFQKKGLQWLNYRKDKTKKNLKLLGLWILGIILSYIISAIPISFASKTLPPHIITAMSGWGIVVIIIMSYFFLKEKIYKSDFFYSALIVACTLSISLLSKSVTNLDYNGLYLIILFLVPFAALIPASIKKSGNKIRASMFAIFAGAMGGISIVFFNLLMRYFFAGGLSKVPLYFLFLYPVAAISGAVSEQASYRLGDMPVVSSMRLGLFIIYPVICSWLLFNTGVDVFQLLSIAIMIFACYGIFKKR